MPALPVGHAASGRVLPGNMLAMGGIALLIIGAAVKSVDGEDFASKTAPVGLAVQLRGLIAYAASITPGADLRRTGMYFDPTSPDVARVDVAAMVNVLGGTYALNSPGQAPSCPGTIVPAVVVFLGKKANSEKRSSALYRRHRRPDGWRHHVALHHLPGRAARVRQVP